MFDADHASAGNASSAAALAWNLARARYLHQWALAERRAHLCDQRGHPSPCWAETKPELQGLVLSETGWQGSGAQLVCLPRYGAVGVRTNDLRSLLRDAGDVGPDEIVELYR